MAPEARKGDKPRMAPLNMLLVYLVLSFGWSGSPGEWTPWAWGIIQYFENFRPRDPRRDGPERFKAWALVDDCVMVEPLLGLRPWLAGALYEEGARRMLGPDAINHPKTLLEGFWAQVRTVWGVDLDSRKCSATLPDKRILKGAMLLASPVYDCLLYTSPSPRD